MLTKILNTYNSYIDIRGTVSTYIPNSPIVEWNLIYSKEKTVRGNHYHPEYDEYMIIVSGLATFTEYNDIGITTINTPPGTVLYIPAYTPHSSTAITDYQFISLLTKKWDECDQPIINIESTQ